MANWAASPKNDTWGLPQRKYYHPALSPLPIALFRNFSLLDLTEEIYTTRRFLRRLAFAIFPQAGRRCGPKRLIGRHRPEGPKYHEYIFNKPGCGGEEQSKSPYKTRVPFSEKLKKHAQVLPGFFSGSQEDRKCGL